MANSVSIFVDHPDELCNLQITPKSGEKGKYYVINLNYITTLFLEEESFIKFCKKIKGYNLAGIKGVLNEKKRVDKKHCGSIADGSIGNKKPKK
jgi:hypothetical protein